ncbi:TPA: hypothetical protein PXN96_004272 [Yersinia enterocolitica]|uniref:hypothetical protein n=1 Tax=Yersinia enterocolitica TaxID=630 RepID=UPI003F4481C8|nr:hypothetical protein [Yersinia enterocolitica]
MNYQTQAYTTHIRKIMVLAIGMHLVSQIATATTTTTTNLNISKPNKEYRNEPNSHKKLLSSTDNYDLLNIAYEKYKKPTNLTFANIISEPFEKLVSEFYNNLSNQQVTLGKEYESLLVDNLWDLYLD